MTELERELAEALEASVKWISEECQPDAEWAAQGHNWNMSAEDRIRARALIADARAVLSRHTKAQEPEGGWQDISTAPKDGTVIDLWFPELNRREVNCYFNGGWTRAEGYPATYRRWFSEPTHYRPLPAPPASEGEQKP